MFAGSELARTERGEGPRRDVGPSAQLRSAGAISRPWSCAGSTAWPRGGCHNLSAGRATCVPAQCRCSKPRALRVGPWGPRSHAQNGTPTAGTRRCLSVHFLCCADLPSVGAHFLLVDKAGCNSVRLPQPRASWHVAWWHHLLWRLVYSRAARRSGSPRRLQPGLLLEHSLRPKGVGSVPQAQCLGLRDALDVRAAMGSPSDAFLRTFPDCCSP